ncbi:hypothetical protein KN10_0964 [Anoxybacillus flavithermus NBRC 109594]|uniref:Uncharacterized protein n=1 Tax=Anoxybacillus flavithermus NBRC 109594 TaxID=1315967 RepID=R4FZY0_9BACL|nr:hypothetical protein KN10_0964 [Anoxybacillus flavithermus NBRC 109594]
MYLLNEKESNERRCYFTRVFSFFSFFYPDCEDSIKDFVEGISINCGVFAFLSFFTSWAFAFSVFPSSLLLILLVCAVAEGVLLFFDKKFH